MVFRGYMTRQAWARAKLRGLWRFLRRFPRDTYYVIRRSWWVARGERQRIIEERDRYKAWGEQQFKRATASENAVHMLKVEHRGASVDLLRHIADQIDCEPGCEDASPLDWSTGVTECHLSERGECRFEHACELRELAAALETRAHLDTRATPPQGTGHV